MFLHTFNANSTDALAYLAAKANGFDDEAASILEASGIDESQVKLPTLGEPLQVPKAIVATHKTNWPIKGSSTLAFEKLLNGGDAEEEEYASANGDEEEVDGELIDVD